MENILEGCGRSESFEILRQRFQHLAIRITNGLEHAQFMKIPHQVLAPVTATYNCYMLVHHQLPMVNAAQVSIRLQTLPPD